MKNIELKIDEKVYKLREMLAKEVDDIDFKDPKAATKSQVMISTSISEEEYLKLTFRERMLLQEAINKLNGITKETENFPEPAKQKTD